MKIDSLQRPHWAVMALAALLAACGGGGGDSGPERSSAAPVDHRVSLTGYAATRSTSAPTATWPTHLDAADFDGIRESLLARMESRDDSYQGRIDAEANALAVPALAAGLRTTLVAAARGDTAAQIATLWPHDAGPWSGRLLQRTVLAVADGLFEPAFVRALDMGNPVVAPGSWSFKSVPAGYDFSPDLPFGTYASQLQLEAGAKLLIVDRVDQQLRWAQAPSKVSTSYRTDSGTVRQLEAMRVEGPTARVQGSRWQALLLRQSEQLLVRLSPDAGSLPDFVKGDLRLALLEVQSQLRSGLTFQAGSLLLAEASANESRLDLGIPAGLRLPFDKDLGDLSGMDGTPSYARTALGFGRLDLDTAGVHLEAGMATAIGPRPNARPPDANASTFGAISSSDTLMDYWDWNPPNCPAVESLRSHVLAWLDPQGRVLALAAIRTPALAGKRCVP